MQCHGHFLFQSLGWPRVHTRSGHSSIVYCLLTRFWCLIACLWGDWDYVFEVVVLYCTWYQGLQSLYFLSSWAPFVHVCWRSGLKVLKVWEIGGHFYYFQKSFILESHHFFETWKIWFGCCINATNFWGSNGFCYIQTLRHNRRSTWYRQHSP